MANEKIRDFQTDICEPIQPPTPERVCPDCIPNPEAIVADWRLSEGEPFLNEKTCEYQVAVLINQEGDFFRAAEIREASDKDIDFDMILQSFVLPGLRIMLRYYEKEEDDSIVCAFPSPIKTEEDDSLSIFGGLTEIFAGTASGFMVGGPAGAYIGGGLAIVAEVDDWIMSSKEQRRDALTFDPRENNITKQADRCRSIYTQMVSGDLPKDFHSEVTRKIEVTTGLPDGSTFEMVIPDPVGMMKYEALENPLNNPDAAELYARAVDYNFGDSPGEPMQVLIAIPAYVMNKIPAFKPPETTTFDGPKSVVLKGPRIKAMLSRLSEALRVYGQYQAYWWQTENATLYQKVELPDGTFVSQTTGGTGTAFTESSSTGNIFGALGGLGLGGSADDLAQQQTINVEGETDYELIGDPQIFYIIKYQQAVVNFYVALHDLLEDNDFRLTAFPNFIGDRAEEVKIVFEQIPSPTGAEAPSPDGSDTPAASKHFSIKAVWAKYDSCGWQKMKTGMNKFRNHPTVKDQTVMGYVANLNKIDEQLLAKTTPPWLDFIVEHTYPPLDTRYESETKSPAGKKSPLGCIADGAGGAESFRNWIFSSVMGLGDAVAYQFNKNSCKLLTDPTFRPTEKKFADWVGGEKEKAMKRVNKHYAEEQRMLRVKGQRISEKQYKNPADKEADLKEIRELTKYSIDSQGEALQHPYRSAAIDAALEEFDMDNSLIGLFIDQAELRKVGLGQPVWKDFKGILGGSKQSKFELFKSRIDKCGLSQLMMKSIQCLMAGVTLEAAYKAVIKAALESMTASNWETLFIGLPMHKQAEVRDKITKIIGDMPPPWEWTPGKNEIPDSQMKAVALDSDVKSNNKQTDINNTKIQTLEAEVEKYDKYDTELVKQLTWATPETTLTVTNEIKANSEERNKTQQRINDLKRQNEKLDKNTTSKINDKGYVDLGSLTEDEREKIKTDITAYQASLGHDPDSRYQQGTLGKNTGKMQKALYDAYIDVLIEEVGVDTLLKAIEKFPGSKLIIDAIKTWDCPYPPLFSPPAASFMSTLSLDFCSGNFSGKISLPRLASLGNISWLNLIKVLFQALLKAVAATAFKMLVTMIVKVLQILESAICKSIELAGKLAVNALTPGDQGGFQGAISDVFCGDEASEKDKEATSSNLLSALGVTPDDLRGMSGEDLMDSHLKVAQTISSVSTRNEIKNLIVMDPRDHDINVLRRISKAVALVNPEYASIFSDPNNISQIFASAGNLLTPTQIKVIREELDAPEDDVPVDDSICLTKQQLDQWNEDRIALFTAAGLPDDLAREWVQKQNDKAQSDLVDACSLAARGVDGPMEDEIAKLIDFENSFGDPECQTSTSALSFRTPETDATKEAAATGIFRTLTKEFQKDLNGGGWIFNKYGVVDHILADRRDKPLRQHESRVQSNFLWPSWANTEEEFEIKKERLSEILPDFLVDAWLGGEGSGLFPDTIGILLQEQLYNSSYNYSPKFTFETFREFKGIKERWMGIDYRFKYQKPALKDPDLILQFRDNVEPSDPTRFGYGFDLRYHSFVLDDISSTAIVSDRFDYDISLDTLLSMDRSDIEESESVIELPRGQTTRIETLRMRIENPVDKARQDILNSLQISRSDRTSMKHTYEGLVFWKYCQSKWAELGVQLPKEMYAGDLWSNLSGKMFKDVSNLMMLPDGQIPTGFKYGYDSKSSIKYEDLLYVNPDANPEDSSTWVYTHDEGEKILGKSATGNPRVQFLDPDIHGGYYSWPKVYIDRFQFEGILSAIQIMVPDIDGCQPKRTDFLDWQYLSNRQKKISQKMVPDKRLKLEEECVKKIPFDLIQTNDIHGYIESTVLATIRTYVSEFILKSLPIMASLEFNDKNFDDSVAQMIVEYMSSDLPQQGRWTDWTWIKRYDYWLHFLEQSYQVLDRRVKMKEMKLDPEMQSVVSDIVAAQRRYVYVSSEVMEDLETSVHLPSLPYLESKYPDKVKNVYVRGRNPFRGKRVLLLDGPSRPDDADYQIMKGASIIYFGKDAAQITEYSKTAPFRTQYFNHIEFDFGSMGFTKRHARRCAKLYTLHSMRDQCKKALKYLVKEELKNYSEKLSSAMTPAPAITNLSKHYIGASNSVINNGLRCGKSASERPISAIDDATGEEVITYLEGYGNCVDVSGDIYFENPLDQQGLEIPSAGIANGQFVVEKYIRIIDKPDEENENVPNFIKNRSENLKGVVNINLFRDYVKNNMLNNPLFNPDSHTLSDLFGDAELLRDLADRATGVIGSIGFKFGVRLSLIPPEGFTPPPATGEMLKVAEREKAYYLKQSTIGGANTKHIFPLVSFEKDVMDDKISSIDWDSDTFGEDLRCYIDNLVELPEFKLIFDNVFPLRRASSMVALYTNYGWLSAIGKHPDERDIEWTNAVYSLADGGGDIWREGIFDGTKRACYKMFLGFYETDSWEWSWDWNMDFNFNLWFKDLAPKIFTNIDPSTRWWQRWRIEQNRPFDKDGEQCDNIIGNLFVW